MPKKTRAQTPAPPAPVTTTRPTSVICSLCGNYIFVLDGQSASALLTEHCNKKHATELAAALSR